MATETVQITAWSDEVSPEPVDDVLVRVFDSTGTTLITEGTTGEVTEGIVEFSLPGAADGTIYQLRFYRAGASIQSPQGIQVFSPASGSPTGANNFEVIVSLLTRATATDANLCRCSGYVRGPDGRAKKGIDMHFIPLRSPLIVGDDVVLGERVAVRTDAAGFVTIDLYRGGIYLATVESHESIQREIQVPDRSSCNIAHLLFPVVAAISYDPEGPYSLAAGTTLELVPIIVASSFAELDPPADDDLAYTTDNESVATVDVLSDRIVVRGHAPGVTYLRATRRDTSITQLPGVDIDGGVVTITVT